MAFNALQYPLALSRPGAISDVSRWLGHIPFAFALVQMMRPRSIVELGTHKGDSYLAFCQAVAALNLNTRCTAVDTWRGDKHSGLYGEDVLRDLRAIHDPRYGHFSRLLQSTFDDAAATFAQGSVDILHIDGLHTYEAVRHDFETWLPKMSDWGVVLFHDIAERRADFGVWRLWDEVRRGRPHFAFEHSLGLGVLGVGSKLPAAVEQFFRDAQADAEFVRAYFASLGDGAEQTQTRANICTVLVQQQLILNNWKALAGQTVDANSASMQAALSDSIGFATSVARQMDAALVEDLQLRQRLRAQKTNARMKPVEPGAKPPKVSVIICSINDQNFAAASAMYARLLSEVPHEIIRISDATGMADGYNRGVDRSTGDVLIFSHDDIEIISPDFAVVLLGRLRRFDLIGLAGTDWICGPTWFQAGPPHLFGQVTHLNDPGTESNKFSVTIYGAPRRAIPNIQAVDGLFMACRRPVFEKIRFDESIGGFHLYDVDFSFAAFNAGFALAVVNDIHAIHASNGKFDERWESSAAQFSKKWQLRLPPPPSARSFNFGAVIVNSKDAILEIVEPSWWDEPGSEAR